MVFGGVVIQISLEQEMNRISCCAPLFGSCAVSSMLNVDRVFNAEVHAYIL